jgi:hypothetical protein
MMAREALHRRCAFALSLSALVAVALGVGCGPEDEAVSPAEESDGGVAVPTAKLERREPAGAAAAEPGGPELAKTTAGAEELFSRLAGEDDEETAESECGT